MPLNIFHLIIEFMVLKAMRAMGFASLFQLAADPYSPYANCGSMITL
jgi:hypothetical protein